MRIDRIDQDKAFAGAKLVCNLLRTAVRLSNSLSGATVDLLPLPAFLCYQSIAGERDGLPIDSHDLITGIWFCAE